MSLFKSVEMAPRDPILGLNEQFNADANPQKVNLGVGVYYDDGGKLPLLQCVQQAEKRMMEVPKARRRRSRRARGRCRARNHARCACTACGSAGRSRRAARSGRPPGR